MKFYRVKYLGINADKIYHNYTVYLFTPLKTKTEVSRYVFNFWRKHYRNGFIVKDIAEISAETFAKENQSNLHTMTLSVIEED